MIKGEDISPISEEVLSGPTYIDILADATARTVNTRFKADTLSWMNAVRSGQLAAQAEHPGFHSDVSFVEFREGYFWSDEVHTFLNIMGRAGAIEVLSPRYRVRVFEADAKADFLNIVDPLVEAQKDAIVHITHALDMQVGLSPLL